MQAAPARNLVDGAVQVGTRVRQESVRDVHDNLLLLLLLHLAAAEAK